MAMFIFLPFAAPRLRDSGQFAVFPVLKQHLGFEMPRSSGLSRKTPSLKKRPACLP